MKIDGIRIAGGTSVDFPIVGADPSGPFVCKSVEGLGPPEIIVSIADTIEEGGFYQGRKAHNRQVVMRVGLQPEWDTGQTAEELRTVLYDFLTPKYGRVLTIKLLKNDVNIAQAKAQISKFEIAVFSSDPEVQMTFDCLSPYLLAPDTIYQDPTKTIVDDQTVLGVFNEGTAQCGFILQIVFNHTRSDLLTISDGSPIGDHMDIVGTWDPGDQLLLDTRPGSRGLWRIPNGVEIPHSILNNLSGDSPWLPLYNGDNTLVINDTDFDIADQGFGYTPAYWGI